MTLGAAEDAVRAPDLVTAKEKMTELRLAGFTAVRVTSNWQARPRPHRPPASSRSCGTSRPRRASPASRSTSPCIRRAPGTTPLDAGGAGRVRRSTQRSSLPRCPSFDDIIVGNEPNLNRFWLPQFAPDGSNASAPAYLSLLARPTTR